MGEEVEKPKPLFKNLSADDPEPETTEIESLCLNCGGNGITRLLLTKIPFYKEVVLMSFDCEHCGFQNNEIQQGGQFEEKGKRITLKVNSQRDLNRQVIKSDYTSVKIPELDFEIPSLSQKGEVTTVEGVLDRTITGLSQDQEFRRVEHPEAAEQLDKFIDKIQHLKELSSDFTMIFEDISGNLFIENPDHPLRDKSCETALFVRNKEHNHALGLYTHEEVEGSGIAEKETTMRSFPASTKFTYEDLQGEVLQFQTNCPDCAAPCKTNMKLTKIPYFKEVVIMATNCEACSHRSNEVKAGGGIEPHGVRLEVKVMCPEDFTRDVLKSETCSMEIPELELEVGPAALGGRFTTVEGLLCATKEQLAGKGTMFTDSNEGDSKQKMDIFIKKMDQAINGEIPVTIVLDDPAGNSYVQSFTDPEPDPALTVTKYTRSFEQNEDLGLNDMKTENYGTNS
ncbi:zinc finger protein Zpr1 [Lycorma delicatula]|uniref:zinc finger protein Zpr1 n=1 Tax=Lycorma delicatula TaxID=130591 RepID=UPI003F5109F1